MKLDIEGRSFVFGDLADEDEARELVRKLLEAEQELFEAQDDGNEERVAYAKREVSFAEGDMRMYAAMSRSDFPWPSNDRQAKPTLTDGERAIVAELRELRRAVLADRIMVADEIGELTRSKAVLSKGEADE